jgi:type IV secretion system protein VirB6
VSVACTAPEGNAGVALLLSGYLDCQARMLGANGFQALAGGPLGTSLLTGLLTIFVGVIGYRFLLGETPGLRNGATWTIRVGIVLALLTGWAAFQTLVYDVAVEGPRELAGILLPASGLPAEGLDGRVQLAYDTIRLGSADAGAAAAPAQVDLEGEPIAQRSQFQPALPRTATLFVISTSGFTGALRIGVGFLLAIAPLAIMCLLFEATLGIFNGWVRAISGLTLATLAATIVTAIGLVLVEAELARIQALRFSGSLQAVDPQSLSVIVILFALIMLVTVAAAARTTSAFKLPLRRPMHVGEARNRSEPLPQFGDSQVEPAQAAAAAAGAGRAEPAGQTRVASIVESLSASVRRESLQASGSAGAGAARAASSSAPGAGETSAQFRATGRRGLGRRTRTSARRDGSA